MHVYNTVEFLALSVSMRISLQWYKSLLLLVIGTSSLMRSSREGASVVFRPSKCHMLIVY
jgi:hypothetical protein